MIWLYIPLGIMFLGGLLLIFGRDWVWTIDSRSEAHEKDANGDPIRTEQWDRAHLLQGIVMVVLSIGLSVVVTLAL